MHTNPRRKGFRSRLTTLAALVCALGALGGCDDLLEVTNPGAIEPEALENPSYIGLMVNGVVGEFQNFLNQDLIYSSVFTDEFRNHHVFFENRDIDMRKNENGSMEVNGTYGILWASMMRSRFMGDSIASRLKTMLGDSARADLRLARVQAYSGLTYTLLGEQLCETPINNGPGNSPEQMFTMALPKFEEAISIATAARARWAAVTPSTAGSRALVAGADSITALARIGAARAALNLGDKAKAVVFANAVAPAYSSAASPGFVFHAYYLENTSNLLMWQAISTTAGSGNRWLSVRNTPFDGITDPRVPLVRKPVMNGEDRTMGGPLVPNSPSAYSTHTGTLPGGEITRSDWVRIASALEARYIRAEAEGMTAANVAFLNERRTVGAQPPLPASLTAAEYMVALRNERARDFFADGHRLGDLRRYDKLYPNRTDNVWQTGPYPGTVSGETYGSLTCWPVPLSERQNNPNYR